MRVLPKVPIFSLFLSLSMTRTRRKNRRSFEFYSEGDTRLPWKDK